MKFTNFYIHSKRQIFSDSFVFRMKRYDDALFNFTAGQYVMFKNPLYRPREIHPFSITSSPEKKSYLEFCIKVYGDWTKKLSLLPKGAIVKISYPLGNFVWDSTIQDAVFLLGGIGISPIMSMLRTILFSNEKPRSLTIIYGNRTPESIAYKYELERLIKKLPLKVVHVFSDLSSKHSWRGHRGFISQKIITAETDLSKNATFYVVGPQIFIHKMEKILFSLHIPQQQIRQESLSNVL